jgi:hypothetical protein
VAYVGLVEKCSNCGYEFPAKQEKKAEKITTEVQQKNNDQVWSNGVKFSSTIRKIEKIAELIFSLLIVAVCVFTFIKLNNLKDITDPIQKFDESVEVNKSIKGLIACLCILIFFDTGMQAISDIVIRLAWRGRMGNGFDFPEYYNRHKNDIVGKNIISEFLIAAEVWYAKKHEKSLNVYGSRFLVLLIDVIFVVVFGIYTTNICQTYIQDIFDATKNAEIQYWGIVIFAAVGSVVVVVCESVFNGLLSKYAQRAMDEFDKGV